MNQINLTYILIAVVLAAVVGGGIFSYYYLPTLRQLEKAPAGETFPEEAPVGKISEVRVPAEEKLIEPKIPTGYTLKNAYIKEANIWIEDLITGEKEKITDIEKVWLAWSDESWKVKLKEMTFSQLKEKMAIELEKKDEEKMENFSEFYWFISTFGIIPPDAFIEWSPDGKKIAFERDSQKEIDKFLENSKMSEDYFEGAEGPFSAHYRDIFVKNIDTGEKISIVTGLPSLLYSFTHLSCGASWSPDSKKIALVTPVKGLSSPDAVKVLVSRIELPKGERGEMIYEVDGYIDNNKLIWFSDNTNLLAVRDKLGSHKDVLMIINTKEKSGQEILSSGSDKEFIRDFALSSDGSKVAYVNTDCAGNISQKCKQEIRVFDFKTKNDKALNFFDKPSISEEEFYSGNYVLAQFSIKDLKWSPDNSLIAFLVSKEYQKHEKKEGEKHFRFYLEFQEDLMIVNLQGEIINTFQVEDIRDADEYDTIETFSWVPDNKSITIEVLYKDKGEQTFNKTFQKLWLVGLNGTKKLISEGNIGSLKWIKNNLR